MLIVKIDGVRYIAQFFGDVARLYNYYGLHEYMHEVKLPKQMYIIGEYNSEEHLLDTKK